MICRKKMPDGSDRPNPELAAMDMLELAHQKEMTWAVGRLWALERMVYEMSERCDKCPYRNQEGSACHDEISY